MKKEPRIPSEVVEPSEEDKTKPFLSLPNRRRSWLWLLVLVLLVGPIGLYLALHKKAPVPVPKMDRLAVQLKVNEILAMEAVVRQERQKLLDQFSSLAESAGLETSGWDPFALTPEQRRLLEQKAGGPQVADYQSGIEELGRLQERIRLQEEQLGTPHRVAEGETHSQIALAFLTQEAGRSESDAREILKRTPLVEPLMPGFKVWSFWLQGEYVTAVTQGEAPLTPEEASRQAQQRQREEKERAVSRLNTLHYLIGTTAWLQERGILSGGFLKGTHLTEMRPDYFRHSIDLRSQRSIRFTARSLKTAKISSVALFPAEFREGIDYSLQKESQGRWAKVTFLKRDLFRGRRIIIAVQ